MKAFDNLRLGRKLLLLVLLVVSCLGAAGYALTSLVRQELMADRLAELRAVVDTAKGIATGLQKKVEAGELTQDQALRSFGTYAGAMTYDRGEGYVFAYRTDGVAVAVPDPKQIGTNKLDVLLNGKAVIRAIRDAVQASGSAVIHYDFPRPGTTQPLPKVSYAVAFPAWDMFLGSGSYIDDLDARVDAVLWKLVAGLIGIAAVISGLAWFIAIRMTRPLAQLQSCMQGLASGDLSIEVPGTERRDEVGSMASAVEVFKINALNARALEQDNKAASDRRMAEDERVRADAQAAAEAAAAALVVGSIGAGLERLATGDLTDRLNTVLPEAYEKLRTDFNKAVSKLQDTMKVVAANTSAIRSGTSEISAGATDLSRRTEQQAASLEETAAALDQITATVRKTSEGADHARKVVSDAKQDAEISGRVVGQAVSAMTAIEQSSRQIGQIIGVIDEIAFQTNLLALNAGVEAARAGDAGRGFAVVASEVRGLAQRSAEAAKEIKTLISSSTKQVEQGVSLVGKTGTALHSIEARVAELSTIVSDIAASTQEQASALNEVNTAINQIDQVTQQNATMVEETTAASSNLAQETEELSRLIGRFRLGDEGAGAGSQSRPGKAFSGGSVVNLRPGIRRGA